MIKDFVLSHVLRPMSHAGATMRQLDTPAYWYTILLRTITYLLKNLIFSSCRWMPVFIIIAWKTLRSSTHILVNDRAERKKCALVYISLTFHACYYSTQIHLTFLVIPILLTENTWRGKVVPNPTYNSPSNILWV